MQTLTPKDLADNKAKRTFVLIDVREPGEFEAGFIAGSTNLPLSTFDPDHPALTGPEPIVFICAVGQRSAIALEMVHSKTKNTRLYNLEGGVISWMRSGYNLENNL